MPRKVRVTIDLWVEPSPGGEGPKGWFQLYQIADDMTDAAPANMIEGVNRLVKKERKAAKDARD